MLYLTNFSTASRGKCSIGVVNHPLREIAKSQRNLFSPRFLDFRRRRGKIENWLPLLKFALMLYLTDHSTASSGKCSIGVVHHPASRNREILEKSFFSKISGFPPQAGRYIQYTPISSKYIELNFKQLLILYPNSSKLGCHF